MRVEQHFGAPMDIEWGLAGGQFALLQSRPIRGLEVAQDVEVGRQQEIARLRALAGGARRVWVTHNLAETLRCPTPLTWDVVREFMSGDGGFGLMYQDLGYRPSRTVREEGFLELIGGQLYADPQRMAQLFWDGMPMTYDLDEVVRDPKVLDRAPSRFDPDQVGPRLLVRLPGIVLGHAAQLPPDEGAAPPRRGRLRGGAARLPGLRAPQTRGGPDRHFHAAGAGRAGRPLPALCSMTSARSRSSRASSAGWRSTS